MLNAYGPAKYAKMSDAEVWKHLNQPLKSGAMYMTEMCHKEAERRGTGINRWLHAVLVFCQYQKDPGIEKANGVLLKEDKFKGGDSKDCDFKGSEFKCRMLVVCPPSICQSSVPCGVMNSCLPLSPNERLHT